MPLKENHGAVGKPSGPISLAAEELCWEPLAWRDIGDIQEALGEILALSDMKRTFSFEVRVQVCLGIFPGHHCGQKVSLW